MSNVKRNMLKEYVNNLALDIEKRPFVYWQNIIFPITYEDLLDGEEIQIEIDSLEKTDKYLHLTIEVYGSGLGSWRPVYTDIVIKNADNWI